MRICTFMRQIDYFDRYYPQMKAIAKRVDEFHIFYLRGTPKPEWSEINFHQFKMRKAPHKVLGVYLSRQKFYKETEKVNPDIYYVLSDSWQQEYMRYCAEKSGKPFVIRIRGDYMEIENAVKDRFWTRIIRNYLRERSFKEADLIIPVSEELKEKFISWNLNHKVSFVVPSGVDFNKFKPVKKRHDNFTVGFAGRLAHEKGVDMLLEIAGTLSDMHFIVAGRNVTNISFPPNVEYLGRIPHDKMSKFYNSIDVLFMPSKTEGMSLALLEAYAHQKPVVLSKEAYPKELPLYGVLCEHTINEYTAALHKIRDIVPIDIRSKIFDYSWDSFGERIVGLLTHVLEG